MLSDSFNFLDYLDLRRRVLHCVANGQFFLLHIVVFVGAVASTLLTATYRPRPNVPYLYFVDPQGAAFFVIWALALGIHGAVAWARSGLSAQRRTSAIEAALRERFQVDTALSDRELFRLYTLLDEQVRQRAKVLNPAFSFAFINTLIWLLWFIHNPASSFPWQVIPFGAIPFGLWLLILSLRRGFHEKAMFNLLFSEQEHAEKRKINRLALTDDGELIDFPASPAQKVKADDEP